LNREREETIRLTSKKKKEEEEAGKVAPEGEGNISNSKDITGFTGLGCTRFECDDTWEMGCYSNSWESNKC
jgi:hypothetical protein